MDISVNIKAIRNAKGISQAELSRRLELDPSSYHRIENRGDKLSIEQLKGIAQALGVSLLEILTWGEVREEPRIESLKDIEIEALQERIKELKDNIADLREINALHIDNQKYREDAAREYYKQIKELEGKINWEGDDEDELHTAMLLFLTALKFMAALSGFDKAD